MPRRAPLARGTRGAARATPAPPALRLDARGFDLIAELKLRSPAAGSCGPRAWVSRRAVAAYARAGAAAVSVLTEPSRFDGSLAHLDRRGAVLSPLGVPAMRKDFLVDPYQVFEARAAGAGGVLVILRMLRVTTARALVDCAGALGLFVLLEAFDGRDIALLHELVDACGGRAQLLVGVNCRDLATLEVVPGRLSSSRRSCRPACRASPRAASARRRMPARVAAAGYDLALVGSALMRGDDPQGLAAALLRAGRAARAAH